MWRNRLGPPHFLDTQNNCGKQIGNICRRAKSDMPDIIFHQKYRAYCKEMYSNRLAVYYSFSDIRI